MTRGAFKREDHASPKSSVAASSARNREMEGKSDMETVCCKVWGIMGSFAGFANFAPEGRMLPVQAL